MKYTIILLFIGLVLCGSFASGQQRTRTLEELKDMAVKNYEALQVMQTNVAQAKLHRDAASADRLPRLDAEASYTWVSETAKIELAIPGVFSREIALGDGNIYSTGLTVSAPLFTGFKLASAVEMRDEAYRIAQQTLEGTKLQVRNAVAQSYLSALLAKKQATVVLAQELGLMNTLRIAKNFVDQAQAIPYDTLVLSTRITQLRVARANAKQQEVRAQLMLEQLCAVTGPFLLDENTTVGLPEEDWEFERLVNEAVNGRYEMKNFESQKRIAALSAKAERGDYYPTLAAFAGYRYGKPGIDQFKNEWMDYFTAGVNLKWNLWAWGADGKKVEEHELERVKTDQQQRLFVAELRNKIEYALNEIDLAKQTMALMQEQIRQEEEKYVIVQARFGQGLAASTDIVDADVSLTAAKLNYEKANIDYYIQLNTLAGLLGKDM